MPTRSEQDFLLRQIRAVAEAIARALGARRGGDQALEQQAFAAAWGELLGPLAPVTRGADAQTIAALLGDARRLVAASDLVAAQAESLAERAGDVAAAPERRRAVALLLQAGVREPQAPGLAESAARLLAVSDAAALPLADRTRLASLAAAARTAGAEPAGA